MGNNGFIKIHRSILDWEWYDDNNTKVLFFHLILSVNYETKNWRGIEIKRGSFITTQANLIKETNLTRQSLRTSLKKLEKTGEITIKSDQGYTQISLCKYDKYQDSKPIQIHQITRDQPSINPTTTNQITNQQPVNNQQLTTTKERKEIKEVNNSNKSKIEFLGRGDFSETLNLKILEFIDFRKNMSKPYRSQKSIDTLVNKLKKMKLKKMQS